MPFEDEVRQECERMTAENAEQPFDGDNGGLRYSNKSALVGAMPSQDAGPFARLAFMRFGKILFLDLDKIMVELFIDGQRPSSTRTPAWRIAAP